MAEQGGAERRVDAATITAMLARQHPGAEVASVKVLSKTDGSASRLRLALEFAPGHDAGLPSTMFLKRNLDRFEFPSEMYSTEVRIYRDVLPSTPLEVPAVFAIESAADDVSFSILMEDLGQRPGVRLGIVTEPTSLDEVDGLLTTLAALHSSWWGGPRLDQEAPWLADPQQNAPMKFWATIGPRLSRRHRQRGHRAGLVDPERWPEDEVWAAFARMVHADTTGPHTLLHGDVHAGNVYYVDGAPGGLIDWQLALRGSWALDVTYLLTTALSIEDRRGHEQALLASYLQRLSAAGIEAPSMDEAWLRYRQNVLYGIAMWLITPDGVHTDEAQVEYLRRCVTAGEDLDTMGALAP